MMIAFSHGLWILTCEEFGASAVIARRSVAFIVSIILATFALGACSSQSTSIVADDAALCQYSTQVGKGADVTQCRSRLETQNRRLAAASATRIDGYALLTAPDQPNAMADRCKKPDAPKDCGAGDITGTIPAQSKR